MNLQVKLKVTTIHKGEKGIGHEALFPYYWGL